MRVIVRDCRAAYGSSQVNIPSYRGTCDNRLNIRTETLAASVLNGLQKHLMELGLFTGCCEEFTQTVNRLRMKRGVELVPPDARIWIASN